MTDEISKSKETIVTRDQTQLVLNNPKVVAIAEKFHWRPKTAIARIQRVLPTVFEQQLYLVLGASFGIFPETMAKLLRIFMSSRTMDKGDLNFKEFSRNEVSSLFSEFSEFVRECLNLIKRVGSSLSVENAAWLVLNCGTNDPEAIVEMVASQLDEFCEFLEISNKRSYEERFRICMWVMVTKIIPFNQELGVPDLLSLSDFVELDREQRLALGRIGKESEIPDYLSMDSRELRNSELTHELKKMGVIE
jgi:hypothetical protein